MKIIQTKSFSKTVKKLHNNQKYELDKIIHYLMDNPEAGELKKGDLSGDYVYKFQMINQLALLAYCYDNGELVLTLLSLGTHENFYRDLKNLYTMP